MKYVIAPRALSDIAAIIDYLDERNPQAAENVALAFQESIGRLTSFPHMGHKQNIQDIRKWLLRKYPYVLYYRVNEGADEIVILSAYHQAQQRPYNDAE